MMKLVTDNTLCFQAFELDNENSLYYGLGVEVASVIKELRLVLFSGAISFDDDNCLELALLSCFSDNELKQISKELHIKSIKLASERFEFYPSGHRHKQYYNFSDGYVNREMDLQEKLSSSDKLEQFEFILIEIAQCARIDQSFL